MKKLFAAQKCTKKEKGNLEKLKIQKVKVAFFMFSAFMFAAMFHKNDVCSKTHQFSPMCLSVDTRDKRLIGGTTHDLLPHRLECTEASTHKS